jgi:RNA polymerase sigma-70 factor (ECF subfamily)
VRTKSNVLPVTIGAQAYSFLLKTMRKEPSGLTRLTDAELVVLAMLGSIPAFDVLIRRYRSVILLAIEQIVRRRAVAEEIAQEVFLKAFKALPTLDTPECFSAWLRAIARRQAFSAQRRESRQEVTADDALEAAVIARSRALHPAGSGDWERRLAQELVFRALDDLPNDQQEVIYLHAYEDWSVAEIATYLSVPEATVRGRLYRARTRLRQHCLNTENEEH